MTRGAASAVLLGLAWFAIANAIASSIAWILARALVASRHRAKSSLLLAVRLLPAAASVLFVATMFLPSQWWFEPPDERESFGVIFYVLAAVAVAVLAPSAGRASAVARAGWRLRVCDRLACLDTNVRDVGVYELQGMSGVSLAGVFRTRILVGPAVRRHLTAAELDVALAHELAHRGAFDNLKRFAIVCAPDLFGSSVAARQVEADWRATAEWLADARAVGGDQGRALDLASALIKVARLGSAEGGALTSPAWSTLHQPPLLEMRVRRLVHGAAPTAAYPAATRSLAVAWLLAAGLIVSSAEVARALHQVTEALVRMLP